MQEAARTAALRSEHALETKAAADRLAKLRAASTARASQLLRESEALEAEVAKLTGEKVLPLRCSTHSRLGVRWRPQRARSGRQTPQVQR
jgi:hypothetical protein